MLVGAALLAGCQPTDSQMVKNGQDEVRQHLKDPDSGNFRNVYFVRGNNTSGLSKEGYVCGEVNAKNAFGAYVGFHPFFVHTSADTRFLIPQLGISHGESNANLITDESDEDKNKIMALVFKERCGTPPKL